MILGLNLLSDFLTVYIPYQSFLAFELLKKAKIKLSPLPYFSSHKSGQNAWSHSNKAGTCFAKYIIFKEELSFWNPSKMRVLSAVLLIFLISDVCGRKKKWLKHPNIVVFKKNTGKVKEIPTEGEYLVYNNLFH